MHKARHELAKNKQLMMCLSRCLAVLNLSSRHQHGRWPCGGVGFTVRQRLLALRLILQRRRFRRSESCRSFAAMLLAARLLCAVVSRIRCLVWHGRVSSELSVLGFISLFLFLFQTFGLLDSMFHKMNLVFNKQIFEILHIALFLSILIYIIFLIVTVKPAPTHSGRRVSLPPAPPCMRARASARNRPCSRPRQQA